MYICVRLLGILGITLIPAKKRYFTQGLQSWKLPRGYDSAGLAVLRKMVWKFKKGRVTILESETQDEPLTGW